MIDCIQTMERRIGNMARMMDRLGLDAADASPETAVLLGIATRRCAFCRWTEPCERWLAAHDRTDSDGSDNGRGYRTFCPNAATFDRLVDGKAAA